MRQTVQQFQRGEDQLGAAIEGRLAQAVDELLVVQAAEALLGQWGPGAVADQALEAVAVPARDLDLGVDRPAAGVVGRVESVDGQVVEVAVAVQPAQAAAADLGLDGGDVIGLEVFANRTVQEGGCRSARAVDGRDGVRGRCPCGRLEHGRSRSPVAAGGGGRGSRWRSLSVVGRSVVGRSTRCRRRGTTGPARLTRRASVQTLGHWRQWARPVAGLAPR